MGTRIGAFFRAHHVWLITLAAAAVAVFVISMMPSLDTAGVATMSAAGLMLSLMHLAIALALWLFVLRVLDRINGFGWRDISDRIEADTKSASRYFAVRLAVVGYIVVQCLAQ